MKSVPAAATAAEAAGTATAAASHTRLDTIPKRYPGFACITGSFPNAGCSCGLCSLMQPTSLLCSRQKTF